MNKELVVATTAVAGLTLAFFSFAWQIIKYFREKKPIVFIELTCEPLKIGEDLFMSITTRIQNKGKRKFNLKHAHIFVDVPLESTESLIFPYLTKYEEGHKDCRVSEFCSDNHFCAYPTHFLPNPQDSEGFYKCFKLSFLSGEAKDIGEKEEFEETKIIKIPKTGFYRTTSVIRPVDAPCMCKSIVLAIPS